MTPNKVIESVDKVRPNPYSEELKLDWLNTLDGIVKRLVFQWDDKYKETLKTQFEAEQITEEEYNKAIVKTKPYVYPDDMDKELIIPFPFDNVYALYLESMLDYYNREYGNYNNSAMLFESRFDEYKKAYIREHKARG